METPNYPSAFRERWYLIVVGALLGVLIAVALAAGLPRTYEASASLFLRVESPGSSLIERSQFALARVKSYPDLVTSPEVLRDTIGELNLDITPEQLATRLSATNPRDTVLLTVTATAPTADLASRTANSVARNVAEVVDDLESDVTLTLTLPAPVPTSAASPQTVILLGLGLLGGLAVGAIAVAAFAQLDPRARSAREVRSLTGLAVVGQLPPSLARTIRRGTRSRRTDEALRSTVVNLRLLAGDRRRTVIALVPAGAGAHDDVVDTAAGLARTLRGAGRSVLVLAAEPTPRRGVGAALAKARDAVSAWVRTPVLDGSPAATHRLLPPVGDPGRTTALLRAVATGITRHEVVLVVADAPTDVFAFSDIAGIEVLVVADRRHTSRSSIVDTATSLEFAGTRPLAVVMTNVGSRARVDLPATWTESDRVEPVNAEVTLPEPAAKPARRPAAHRPRRKPAAAAPAESVESAETVETPDSAETVAESTPTEPDAEARTDDLDTESRRPDHIDEPLPGFDEEQSELQPEHEPA